MNILIALVAATGLIQSSPEDIKKSDLPKGAPCTVCAANGEGHGDEKPAAGVRFGGKNYYFCNVKEVAEFKQDPEAYLPPVLPRPAAKLSASTLDGKTVTLDDYKGKVVLVDFWATWCVPCVKAMPDIEKLYKAKAEQGFVVLGVSIDEEQKKAIDFQKKRKFSYPILLDSSSEPTWAAWKVKAIPALFLIGRDGQVVAQWRGKIDHKEIAAAVDKALKE